MVKIANVCPVYLLKDVIDNAQDYHVIYSQPASDNWFYQRFYADHSAMRQDIIICPSWVDGNTLDLEKFYLAIGHCRPNHIVIPFKAGDPNMEIFYNNEHHTAMWNHWVVLDGKNYDEVLLNAGFATGLKRVSCLVVEAALAKKLAMPLKALVLKLSGALKGTGTEFHLSGLSDDLSELRDRELCSVLKGVETTKIIRHGLQGNDFTTEGEIKPLEPISASYMGLRNFDSSSVQAVRNNIKYWNEVVSEAVECP